MNGPSTEVPIQFSDSAEALIEPSINELMRIPLEEPDILSLAAGFTDNDALPMALVRETVDRLLSDRQNKESLQYGTTPGRPDLRRLTCNFLNQKPSEQAGAFQPDQTLITNGSQQALYIAMQTLCDPGDYILVESPTYFVMLSLLQGLQINPIGMPANEAGEIDLPALDQQLEELRQAGKTKKLRAVYIMGYFANPSSRSIGLEEKTGLAEILKKHSLLLPVIEDAAYRDLAYAPVDDTPSILSIPEYADFPKLYTGTYTKPFASGLKVGFCVCSHREWLNKIVYSKGNQDFGTANFNQKIIEEILKSGEYGKLTIELGRHYQEKALRALSVLENSKIADKGWKWREPKGGLLMWLQAPIGINTDFGERFSKECKDRGVIYVPGAFCFASGEPHHFIRLSIGTLNNDLLKVALERFTEVAFTY